MPERSPEHHPSDRAEDRGFWATFWHGRFYRDIWLVLVTGLVVVALSANSDRVDDIQEERAYATRVSCEDTNARNLDTKARLDELIKATPEGPYKERAKMNRASTELLIDALVPLQDCDELVRERVGIINAEGK